MLIGLTLEDRYDCTIGSIQYSDEYEELLEDGGDEFLLKMFNDAIEILKMRMIEKKCHEEFNDEEEEVLSLVLGLIGEE